MRFAHIYADICQVHAIHCDCHSQHNAVLAVAQGGADQQGAARAGHHRVRRVVVHSGQPRLAHPIQLALLARVRELQGGAAQQQQQPSAQSHATPFLRRMHLLSFVLLTLLFHC